MIAFNQNQVDFLKREFGLTFVAGKDANLTRDEWVKLKDDVFEIEADELLAAGKNNLLSERGNIACSIVDMSYAN